MPPNRPWLSNKALVTRREVYPPHPPIDELKLGNN